MYHIIAKFSVKSEHKSTFASAMRGNIPKTQEEAGCKRFEVYVEREQPHHIWLIETWQDEPALAAHYKQPYARAVLDHVDDWLTEPPTILKVEAF